MSKKIGPSPPARNVSACWTDPSGRAQPRISRTADPLRRWDGRASWQDEQSSGRSREHGDRREWPTVATMDHRGVSVDRCGPQAAEA